MNDLTNRSKHFIMMEVGDYCLFGDRNDSGVFEACGDYRLQQGPVEDVCEHLCQLNCTHPENTARMPAGPGALCGLTLLKDLHTSGAERENLKKWKIGKI